MNKQTNAKKQPRTDTELVAPTDVPFVDMYREEQELTDRHEQIKAVAYDIWLERGQPHGTEEKDWFEAERRVNLRDSSPTERGR